ncbi:hypothetical protein WISP_82872 [Willisornis vidua]|uniref:Uncharacterized protein n=1 Tax=Willisornis vidua TaxID=1566151 RepID=A0ABQ9D6Y0_9PASS|nr:hypothetical protein WISP_82872 [Willisornis vidua]
MCFWLSKLLSVNDIELSSLNEETMSRDCSSKPNLASSSFRPLQRGGHGILAEEQLQCPGAVDTPSSSERDPGRSCGVMVSTPDSGSQGREFPYRAVKCLPAIRSRQISDAQQGKPRLVPGAVDSPEDFTVTVTVQACSVVADGPQD